MAALIFSLLAGWSGCGTVYDYGSPLMEYRALDRYERKIITRPDGSRMDCYVSKLFYDEPAPLVFFCQGSGCFSLFESLPSGDLIDGNAWFWELSANTDRIRFAFVEKRGVPFGSPRMAPDDSKLPVEFLRHDRLEERVQDVGFALDALLRDLPVDPKRVVLIGYGQGAPVAAAAARLYPEVTHLGYLAAGGLPRIYERVLMERDFLARSDLTPAEREEKMDELFQSLKEALKNPDDFETPCLDATPAQICSYELYEPMADLMRLTQPVFLAMGSADGQVPPVSMDRIRLESLLKNKDHLTLRIYPGLDHGFSRWDRMGLSGETPFQLPLVFDAFCDWFFQEEALETGSP
ncbi:MAG: alpha/beta fold hydrolase [Planctomycetes bacterium]|nr:alpha/beta fold hydrolase [Planctomycetota bacterium]